MLNGPTQKDSEPNSTSSPTEQQSSQPKPPVLPAPTRPQSPPAPTQPETTNDKSKNRGDLRNNIRLGVEIAGLVVLTIYTAFSGCQAHYSHVQADAAIRAADDATESLNTIKKQFQLDQRPYVAVSGPVVIDPVTKSNLTAKGKPATPTVGQPIIASMEIRNVGKSPAYNVITHRHILFGIDARNIRSDPKDTERDGIPMNVGDVSITTAISVQDTFAKDTSANSATNPSVKWDGSSPIIVFGRVSYEDGFGNTYCTPYMGAYDNGVMWAQVQQLIPPYTSHIKKAEELCPTNKP